MSQAHRGSIVLTTAGGLLVIAVAAYLMGDFQSNMRRQEEVLFEREMRRNSRASAIELRRELANQRAAIDEARRRIDDLTGRLAATHDDLEALKHSRQGSTSLEQAERDQWPAARAN